MHVYILPLFSNYNLHVYTVSEKFTSFFCFTSSKSLRDQCPVTSHRDADNIPCRVICPPFEASLCFLVRHQFLQKQSTVYQLISILVLSLSQIC